MDGRLKFLQKGVMLVDGNSFLEVEVNMTLTDLGSLMLKKDTSNQ